MSQTRRCSRTGCGRGAVATLTYVYSDQTAVLGPLATYAEPHTYDLCGEHATRLTAPRGWQVVRLTDQDVGVRRDPDDLLALADVVRQADRPHRAARPDPPDSSDRAGRPGRSAAGGRSTAAGRSAPRSSSDDTGTATTGRDMDTRSDDGVVDLDRRRHLRMLKDS